jgi:hypothetical protein
VQQPIKVHPFAIHDYGLLKYRNRTEAFSAVERLYLETKKVNGSFVTVFSNELIGGESKLNWKKLYSSILKRVHV